MGKNREEEASVAYIDFSWHFSYPMYYFYQNYSVISFNFSLFCIFKIPHGKFKCMYFLLSFRIKIDIFIGNSCIISFYTPTPLMQKLHIPLYWPSSNVRLTLTFCIGLTYI